MTDWPTDKEFHQTLATELKMAQQISEKLTEEERAWLIDAAGNASEKAYRRGFNQGFAVCERTAKHLRQRLTGLIETWRTQQKPDNIYYPPGSLKGGEKGANSRFLSEATNNAFGYWSKHKALAGLRDPEKLKDDSAHNKNLADWEY